MRTGELGPPDGATRKIRSVPRVSSLKRIRLRMYQEGSAGPRRRFFSISRCRAPGTEKSGTRKGTILNSTQARALKWDRMAAILAPIIPATPTTTATPITPRNVIQYHSVSAHAWRIQPGQLVDAASETTPQRALYRS